MSKASLVLHPVGAEVPFGGGTAIVTAIAVRGPSSDHVAYELVWWSNGCRNCASVEAVEIVPPRAPLTIGFTAG